MAFQFKDDEGDKLRPGPPQPILHKPKTTNPFIARIVIAFCALVVLVAAGFLMYKGGLFRDKGKEAPVVEQIVPSQTQATDPSVQDTTQASGESASEAMPEPAAGEPKREELQRPATQQAAPPPVQAEKQDAPVEKAATPEDGLARAAAPSGMYTIYIGSFPRPEVAERIAERWIKAGEEAFVTRYEAWNRVSLGRYGSRAEAVNAAEKLKDSFENGYWVGKLP